MEVSHQFSFLTDTRVLLFVFISSENVQKRQPITLQSLQTIPLDQINPATLMQLF